MRYCYHNQAYIRSGAPHGLYCDPVKQNEKCIVGRGNQLVQFTDGSKVVVIRRALRLKAKCKIHNNQPTH